MSSVQAIQYHSITIGEKNTWDDWHLVPTSRPLVSAPQIRTSFVDLPGADGSLDLTNALTGRPTFQRRSGSWEFLVMNDYSDWCELYSEIMMYIQGQEFKIILDDDPGYYYTGRVALNQWRSDPNWSKIVINYNVDPYKREVAVLGDDWLWDPFNFETGVIRAYKNMPINGILEVTFITDLLPVSPSFITTKAGVTMTALGNTYNLVKGYNHFPSLIFESGEYTITFTGSGKVTIESEVGRL